SNVAVYSMRAGDEPLVSMPLGWKEIEEGANSRNIESPKFSPGAAIERIRIHRDLFAPVLKLHQELPQKLLRDWKIISAPTNLISLMRAKSTEPRPRSSGQGGRREFFVYSPAKKKQELALRIGDELHIWELSGPMHDRVESEIRASEMEQNVELRNRAL